MVAALLFVYHLYGRFEGERTSGNVVCRLGDGNVFPAGRTSVVTQSFGSGSALPCYVSYVTMLHFGIETPLLI
jgi:hypothetical protein